MSRSRRCLYQTQATWGSSETVPSSYSATGGDMTGCVNLTRIFYNPHLYAASFFGDPQ